MKNQRCYAHMRLFFHYLYPNYTINHLDSFIIKPALCFVRETSHFSGLICTAYDKLFYVVIRKTKRNNFQSHVMSMHK